MALMLQDWLPRSTAAPAARPPSRTGCVARRDRRGAPLVRRRRLGAACGLLRAAAPVISAVTVRTAVVRVGRMQRPARRRRVRPAPAPTARPRTGAPNRRSRFGDARPPRSPDRWAAVQDEQSDLVEAVVTHVKPDSDQQRTADPVDVRQDSTYPVDQRASWRMRWRPPGRRRATRSRRHRRDRSSGRRGGAAAKCGSGDRQERADRAGQRCDGIPHP